MYLRYPHALCKNISPSSLKLFHAQAIWPHENKKGVIENLKTFSSGKTEECLI